MFKRIFNFFVFSNIFIAGCAVLMAYQTSSFLLHTPANTHFLLFVLLATVCSYSFHWYLSLDSVIPSPRIEWEHRNKGVHLFLFIIGMIGSGIFFFYLRSYWEWLSFSALITFLYSAPKIPNRYFRALRKVALGKTIFLALVWTHVTTILPIIVSGRSWETGFTLFVSSRFFLIYAICILFDYRDRSDDKAIGVRSLITYLSEKGITNLFVASLVIFLISTLLLLRCDYSLISVAVLLIPGIITASLYNYARRNFSDIVYYFVLDGLMALSAIIMLIPGI